MKITTKIILFFVLLIVLTIGGYLGFIGYKINSFGKKITTVGPEKQDSFIKTLRSLNDPAEKTLRHASPDRLNVLLLGIAGKGKPGQFLTDTIMLASINLKTYQVSLLSIPRDLFVKISESAIRTKINSVYQLGLNDSGRDSKAAAEQVAKVVSEITSVDVDYYAVLDFSGFEKLVDSIGGININNERDLLDRNYPGPNYSYETFELAKGFHHLDGATALKYARERHSDPEGDFGRAKRQQQVMQAIKNRIFSAATFLNVFALSGLFDTLGENITTDIAPSEIGSFLELAKKLDTQNANTVVLTAWDKESLLKVTHIPSKNGVQAFALVPRVGNFSEVQELAQNIFDLNALKRTRDEISQEDAEVAILNRSGDPRITARIQKLLQENLSYKKVTMLKVSDKSVVEKSTVYDLTHGTKPFTANELITKLPATISYENGVSFPSGQSVVDFDLVAVIGKDLVDRYNMEEGTLEDLNRSRDDQEAQDLIKNY